eukprot:TRINITY_DN1169_c1_g1_i2.p1 TRINITY_DN1169_c1_g1~~TRINITY_DN1169_c1_g1_i2.p1  ORF type:complete len:591 (+),score=182.83 TRINITY_DN1169_c1_g1_i2:1893-3665(+)
MDPVSPRPRPYPSKIPSFVIATVLFALLIVLFVVSLIQINDWPAANNIIRISSALVGMLFDGICVLHLVRLRETRGFSSFFSFSAFLAATTPFFLASVLVDWQTTENGKGYIGTVIVTIVCIPFLWLAFIIFLAHNLKAHDALKEHKRGQRVEEMEKGRSSAVVMHGISLSAENGCADSDALTSPNTPAAAPVPARSRESSRSSRSGRKVTESAPPPAAPPNVIESPEKKPNGSALSKEEEEEHPVDMDEVRVADSARSEKKAGSARSVREGVVVSDDSPPELKKLKKMDPWIGVIVESGRTGLRITETARDGPAIQASLTENDEIMEIDGSGVETVADLEEIEKNLLPGSTVDVFLKRALDGRVEVVSVEVWAKDSSIEEIRALRSKIGYEVCEQPVLTESSALKELRAMKPIVGLRIIDGPEDGVEVVSVEVWAKDSSIEEIRALRSKIGYEVCEQPVLTESSALKELRAMKPIVGLRIIDGPEDGVKVTDVKESGPSGRATIGDDDIIQTVGGESVTTNDEFGKVLSQYMPGDVVRMVLDRCVSNHGEPEVDVEIGAQGKRNTVERVRAMRKLANLRFCTSIPIKKK